MPYYSRKSYGSYRPYRTSSYRPRYGRMSYRRYSRF